MNIRNAAIVIAVLTAAPLAAHATPALTATVSTITTLDFDPSVAGRGVCITAGAITTGSSWACMVTTNALYSEVTAAVMSAYFKQASCQFLIDSASPPTNAQFTLVGIVCHP